MPPLGDDIRFSGYARLNRAGSHQQSRSGNNAVKELLAQIRTNLSVTFGKETHELVMKDMYQMIATYSVAAQDMDVQERLQMQVDSFMFVEIRNWVRCNMQIDVTLTEFAKAKTFGLLLDVVLERLKLTCAPESEEEESEADYSKN